MGTSFKALPVLGGLPISPVCDTTSSNRTATPPIAADVAIAVKKLSVEAMMRLQFGVGWLCCEDSTGDCKSENHNTIIWSSAPNPNILGNENVG
mmetsp:Transcript_77232/g.154815  ORF Transcript_77232/g.154815 Transcript_77232/m.154815 type:complete len:94 (+) Transcript_77232:777-1058(+)